MKLFVTYLYDLGGRFDLHKQIHDLCRASFQKHLDAQDYLTFRGSLRGGQGSRKAVRNHRYSKMLMDLFQKVRALWDQGHDILLVDGDTLCTRSTPWPQGDDMRMFNMANALVPQNAYPRSTYLHSGVKLFPQTMDPALWDVGQAMFDAYDCKTWAYDQLIWNRMFWAQPSKLQQNARSYADPRYCWCVPHQYDNLDVKREHAYIVHYCATRGLEKCLQRMSRDAH